MTFNAENCHTGYSYGFIIRIVFANAVFVFFRFFFVRSPYETDVHTANGRTDGRTSDRLTCKACNAAY